MAARNDTIEQERASFLACFRRDPAGLVYSRTPGGEGRLVSEDEAAALLTELDLMSHRHARRFSRSVWVAVIGFPLFIIAGAILNPLFGILAIAALCGWFVVAVVQRLARARFVAGVWPRLDRNPPVRALSRAEKLARGFAIPWWQTLLIFAVGAPLVLFVKAPPSALPQVWRDWQMVAIALFFIAAILMLVWGGIRQWRRRGAARGAGRP
jgi:hypothetical protein